MALCVNEKEKRGMYYQLLSWMFCDGEICGFQEGAECFCHLISTNVVLLRLMCKIFDCRSNNILVPQKEREDQS
jgi:hypothetical protein